MKKPELLAPAGNMDALKQAIHHGADAIYLGGAGFSARAFADNFSPDALRSAVDYAHLYGKKVYVTVNTLIGQAQWDELYKTLSFLNDIGVDAVILQDMGAAKMAHACFPHLPWHASTQMHNHNVASVKFAQALGAERIVLAREMRLEDITALKSLKVQTEVFIHGAICIAYSGQCLFSALTQGRSGNKGACAQVCRMRYRLLKTEHGQTTEVPTDGEFLLSPKDLGVLDRIGELMDAGIDSLKIEGRMKSPEYVGYVTALYRRLIDDYAMNGTSKLAEMDTETLARLFNRGFTQGLLLDAFGQDLMSSDRPNHRGVKIGRVAQTTRNKITIVLDAPLNQGDGIKFENTDKGMITELIYKNDLLVNGAQQGDTIQLDNKPNLMGQDTVLLTQDKKLNERLASFEPIHIPVDFNVSALLGKPLTVTLSDGTHTLTETGAHVSAAQNTPTDAETIQAQLARLGDTAFELAGFSLQSDENIFIPKSELNQLRRTLSEQLTKARTAVPHREKVSASLPTLFNFSAFKPLAPGFSVLVRKETQYQAAKDYPFVRIYTDDKALCDAHPEDTRLFWQTPRAGGQGTPNASRLLVTETDALFETSPAECVADYTLNAHNIYTLALLLEKGAGLVTLSPELNDNQTEELTKAFTQTFGFTPPLEATIYGRHELMLIKNCIVASALKQDKHCDACRTASYGLKDRHGQVYPLTTDAFCHTHIFEVDDINRLSDLETLKSYGMQSFRLSLLSETEADCTTLFEQIFK